jgi:hypothetical protein
MMNDQELIHSPVAPFQIALSARKAAHHNGPVLIQSRKREK